MLNAGWEIDFWGKFRRATEAARAELLGTEEGRRTVVLTLVSAVAASYVDIRALDKQLAITRSTAESRKATLDLFQQRFDNGIISEVDLSQAESEYEDALARIPDIERAIGQTENALSVLLGRDPGPDPARPDARRPAPAGACRRACPPTCSNGGRTSSRPSRP